MCRDEQIDLYSTLNDMASAKMLLEELQIDLEGKISRLRQLDDLNYDLGSNGSILTGGEVVYHIWQEVRSSFIHGNYVAVVLLCQSMAEHLLASYLEYRFSEDSRSKRMHFRDTIQECWSRGIITEIDKNDLLRLSHARNPLTHHRTFEDPTNLTRLSVEAGKIASDLLRGNANFAIRLAFRLLSLPAFRVD